MRFPRHLAPTFVIDFVYTSRPTHAQPHPSPHAFYWCHCLGTTGGGHPCLIGRGVGTPNMQRVEPGYGPPFTPQTPVVRKGE